jgi:UDPglucose 6-dehydrogenase
MTFLGIRQGSEGEKQGFQLDFHSMKITVIGLGYLGATHAVAMAELGHQVIGIEPDKKRLEALASGKLPFHEPGLDKALVDVIEKKRIVFKADHDEESLDAELHFLCVGTPQRAGSYEADTSYLFAAIKSLSPYLARNAVVAGKSTVPVGTALELKRSMDELTGFDSKLAWNPEFLREGTALEDSLRPDRIVIGVEDETSERLLREVYKPITDVEQTPFLVTDIATSELVKVAANSFLATKISFINAMAEIAEVSGADTVKLAEAIGMDDRIGKLFLRNGIGFGGGCLPKDIRGFMARAEQLGVGSAVSFLGEMDQINQRRRARVVDIAKAELGNLTGKKILVLGAAFKPDSDDLRDSPALAVANQLAMEGAEVVIHDPMALERIPEVAPALIPNEDLVDASTDADAVVLATEWRDYKNLDPNDLSVKNKLVIDGRNALDVDRWQQAGWKLIALGRNVHL